MAFQFTKWNFVLNVCAKQCNVHNKLHKICVENDYFDILWAGSNRALKDEKNCNKNNEIWMCQRIRWKIEEFVNNFKKSWTKLKPKPTKKKLIIFILSLYWHKSDPTWIQVHCRDGTIFIEFYSFWITERISFSSNSSNGLEWLKSFSSVHFKRKTTEQTTTTFMFVYRFYR